MIIQIQSFKILNSINFKLLHLNTRFVCEFEGKEMRGFWKKGNIESSFKNYERVVL
jgi:hypothetical protein